MSATPNPQAPLMRHEVSLFHPETGSFLGGTQGDLWPVVVRPTCYIVDNNVPWERVAREEPSTHFVLGRTMVLESDSLRGAVRRLEHEPLPNVFTLEIVDVRGRKAIAIDRLGSTLQVKFRGRIPTVESRTDAQTEEVNATNVRETKRMVVRQHEQRGKIELLAAMMEAKKHAYRNYALSGEISLMAYALHLADLRCGPDVSRVQRFEQNHPNLFGDAEIIQEALFLGVSILSNEQTDVGRMAALLGIPFRSAREGT